ncbi:MAG TPA: LUD domain-containing protein [Draconibacterium sp.]|nr:LUD domain-containing protein [Draconibacterium sp.]
MSSARQEIIKKLRKVTLTEPDKPDFNAPVYHSIDRPLEEAFKQKLEEVNGSVHLFESEEILFDTLKQFLSRFDNKQICCSETDLQKTLNSFDISYLNCTEFPKHIEAGITGCEFLIAHTGSVMVSSAQKGGRQMFVYPPVHLVIAKKIQLVAFLEDAYSEIMEKYRDNLPSQITLITGPSRTADIEKTLILGAHGPRELHVFIA